MGEDIAVMGGVGWVWLWLWWGETLVVCRGREEEVGGEVYGGVRVRLVSFLLDSIN